MSWCTYLLQSLQHRRQVTDLQIDNDDFTGHVWTACGSGRDIGYEFQPYKALFLELPDVIQDAIKRKIVLFGNVEDRH